MDGSSKVDPRNFFFSSLIILATVGRSLRKIRKKTKIFSTMLHTDNIKCLIICHFCDNIYTRHGNKQQNNNKKSNKIAVKIQLFD